VNTGKGYVIAERNRPEDAPIWSHPGLTVFTLRFESLLQGREHP